MAEKVLQDHRRALLAWVAESKSRVVLAIRRLEHNEAIEAAQDDA